MPHALRLAPRTTWGRCRRSTKEREQISGEAGVRRERKQPHHAHCQQAKDFPGAPDRVPADQLNLKTPWPRSDGSKRAPASTPPTYSWGSSAVTVPPMSTSSQGTQS